MLFVNSEHISIVINKNYVHKHFLFSTVAYANHSNIIFLCNVWLFLLETCYK